MVTGQVANCSPLAPVERELDLRSFLRFTTARPDRPTADGRALSPAVPPNRTIRCWLSLRERAAPPLCRARTPTAWQRCSCRRRRHYESQPAHMLVQWLTAFRARHPRLALHTAAVR